MENKQCNCEMASQMISFLCGNVINAREISTGLSASKYTHTSLVWSRVSIDHNNYRVNSYLFVPLLELVCFSCQSSMCSICTNHYLINVIRVILILHTHYTYSIVMLTLWLGFDLLLQQLNDLSLDAPNACEVLGSFIARAIADDCLPPAYVQNHHTTSDPFVL